MAGVGPVNLPDSQVGDFVVPNSVPDADPSDTILFLAQLDKSLSEIKDPSLKVLAADEVKFFRMAAAIITSKDTDKAYDAVRLKFGAGVDGVKKLAAALRQVAIKKQAEGIIAKVSETEYDAGGGKIKVNAALDEASKNAFRY
jgi:hypothetical protein